MWPDGSGPKQSSGHNIARLGAQKSDKSDVIEGLETGWQARRAEDSKNDGKNALSSVPTWPKWGLGSSQSGAQEHLNAV